MTTHLVLPLNQVDSLAYQLRSDAPLDRDTRDLVAYLLIAFYGKLAQEDVEHERMHRRVRRCR